jgi:hypothetical protein
MSDPQALHAELLAEVHRQDPYGLLKGWRAVKVVLELHKLYYDNNPLGEPFAMCEHCGYGDDGYPCETVKAIGSALGVTTDG